jgi:TRAP-type C4-dicarboxylate transport system substrate-binding protein
MRQFIMSALKRILVIAALAVGVVPVLAAPVTINLGTLVPANTTWFKALQDMGARWKTETEGRVTLIVHGGGSQGDEASTIAKMRPGFETLQAVFLMPAGLAEIDDSFNVLSMPFFMETPDEEAAIEKKLMPLIEQRLQAKGYHLLCWGSGGWVQLFSKKPLRTLADVKAAKLYTSKGKGSEEWIRWYVGNGFHPVALLPADIPGALKVAVGPIDTAPYPPYLALSMQIFQNAKYMLDVHIAPLTAALIVSNLAWNKLSPEDREKVTAAAQAFEARVRVDAPKQDDTSVALMKTKGLEVITPDAKAAAEFRAAAGQLVTSMRGTMVPNDIFDAAVQARDAVRKAKGK